MKNKNQKKLKNKKYRWGAYGLWGGCGRGLYPHFEAVTKYFQFLVLKSIVG